MNRHFYLIIETIGSFDSYSGFSVVITCLGMTSASSTNTFMKHLEATVYLPILKKHSVKCVHTLIDYLPPNIPKYFYILNRGSLVTHSVSLMRGAMAQSPLFELVFLKNLAAF